MHPISEDMIERFLLAPHEMDAADLSGVITHVAHCESCRHVMEMLRDHYAELHGGEGAVLESVDRLMVQIFSD